MALPATLRLASLFPHQTNINYSLIKRTAHDATMAIGFAAFQGEPTAATRTGQKPLTISCFEQKGNKDSQQVNFTN